MALNTKGVYYRANTDAVSTVEAQALATADSVPVGPNYIINGAMDVWQRGTSFTAMTLYGADRWRITASATGVSCNVTRVSGPDGSLIYAVRYLQSASATSVVEYAARQFLETQHVSSLAGKTVTVSFWYRSNRTGNHSVRLSTNTRATGGSEQSLTFSVSAANTWVKYSLTFNSFASVTAWTAAANDWGAFLDIGFRTASVGDFTSLAANDYFELSGVQLEAGSSATPFRRNASSLQGEISACLRYYWRVNGTASGDWVSPLVVGISGTQGSCGIYFPVRMRISPTVSFGGTLYGNHLWSTNSVITSVNSGGNVDMHRVNFVGNTWSTGAIYMVAGTTSAAYLEFSAEL